jgi:hypothetical protein
MNFNNVISFFGHRKAVSNTAAVADVPQFDERMQRDGRIASPEGGWEPAGTAPDGSLVIQSLVSGRYCVLQAQDLTERKLWLLLGPDYCERYTVTDPKTRKRKFEVDSLVREMVSSCQDFGPFDWTRVRGPGLHRDGDELIVNDGERVTTAAGRRIVAAPDYTGPCYQAGSSLGFTTKTPCATQADIEQVLQTFSSFGFRADADRVTTLGWFGAAVYGPALPAQWLLAVTADRGSGKTSMAELTLLLLGEQAFRRDGIPTKAQVLAKLEERPMTLVVDEAESSADKKMVADLFEILRSGTQSSSQKNHARVRGGRLHHYNAPAGAMLAGISLPTMDPATEGRSVKVQLDRLPHDRRLQYQPLLDLARCEETKQLGARLRRLLVSRWPVMRDTLRLAQDTLTALGHESRDASKWATIMAGYVALTQETPATAQQVEHLIGLLGLRQPAEVAVDRDGERCLSWLFGRKVAIYAAAGTERCKQHARIYDVIQEVLHGPQEERRHLIQQLEEFGLRPLWSKGKDEAKPTWKLAICGSNDHQGMRRLMQQSTWAHGGWKEVLARLPGATSEVQRVAGRVERVVVVPMPTDLLEAPEPETYELPTPQSEPKPARDEYLQ